MFFYVQFLSGSARGNRKIISASDFRHPPLEETAEKINKNKKYKVYGEDGKTFVSVAILFVSENLDELQEIIKTERSRFNEKYLDSSSSSDVNSGQLTIDKKRDESRDAELKSLILKKQNELFSKPDQIVQIYFPAAKIKTERLTSQKKENTPPKNSKPNSPSSPPAKKIKINKTKSQMEKNTHPKNSKHVSPLANNKPYILDDVLITSKNVPGIENVEAFQKTSNKLLSSSTIEKPSTSGQKERKEIPKTEHFTHLKTTNSMSHGTSMIDKSITFNYFDKSITFNDLKTKDVLGTENIEPFQITNPDNSLSFSSINEQRASSKSIPVVENIRNVHSKDEKSNVNSKLSFNYTNPMTDDNHTDIILDNMLPVISASQLLLDSESITNFCTNLDCQSRLLKAEETISNLTRLLNQQLQIVDEQRIEIRLEKERNAELHLKIENSLDEFQARMFDMKEKSCLSSHPPTGFIRSSDDHIHLDRGVWLPRYKYNEACSRNSTSLFVKLLCDMIFTQTELQNSTVSGKPSNRQKNSEREFQKLDSTKVLALKDITKYWLEKSNNSAEVVDEAVGKVKSYISAKIAELQRTPDSKKKYRKSNKKGEKLSDSTSENLADSADAQIPALNNQENFEIDDNFDNLPSSDSD